MSPKLIPLYSNIICYLYNVTSVLKSVKITIFTPSYDLIVKFEKIGLTALFGPYRKKDEPYIGSNSLKMFIRRPFTKNNVVYGI